VKTMEEMRATLRRFEKEKEFVRDNEAVAITAFRDRSIKALRCDIEKAELQCVAPAKKLSVLKPRLKAAKKALVNLKKGIESLKKEIKACERILSPHKKRRKKTEGGLSAHILRAIGVAERRLSRNSEKIRRLESRNSRTPEADEKRVYAISDAEAAIDRDTKWLAMVREDQK